MFCQVSATPRPKTRLPSVSMPASPGPQRQRQAKQPYEDGDGKQDQKYGQGQHLQQAHVTRRIGTDHDQHRDGGNKSKPLQREREQHDRSETDEERACLDALDRRALEHERASRNDQPKADQQGAYESRKHARPDAMQVAEPVLQRQRHKRRPEHDEDQAGPEVLRGTDVHRNGRNREAQSGFTLAFSTISFSRAISPRTRASSAALVMVRVSAPPAANRSLISGRARIFATSALSLSTIGCGVAFGANMPTQFDASTSGMPSCCSVFHSGLKAEFLAVVSASTRTRPDFTCGSAEEIASTPSGTSPAATAAPAGAPPR